MNQSIRIENSVELINITPINPLISKCQIKVCYVGDEPNRNRSIITKETAYSLANSLPGSPIVGYYNSEKQDFEGHNRSLAIVKGKLVMKDETRPYGFVDLNAKVWFEKFLDDGIEHEYLMTEGWIWTGQYPESKRIIDKGNNQSMELDDKIIDAYWTKDYNGKPKFFIINEAIVSKLCILGEDVEPCFEGANITKEIKFSLEDDFKNKMFSLMEEMKNILEGGASTMENTEMLENVEEVNTPAEEPVSVEEEEVVVEPVAEEQPAEEGTNSNEDGESADPVEPIEETKPAEVEEPTAATYNLNDVVEYQTLMTQFTDLKNQYNEMVAKNESLSTELETLRIFKAGIDKKEKESMINSFYMLSDEDKKDVVENIDTYSVDEIEAKLSIICVRNKVSFNLEENNTENKVPVVYNFEDCPEDSAIPAWVKSLQSVAESMK